jgi:hypothetical protein
MSLVGGNESACHIDPYSSRLQAGYYHISKHNNDDIPCCDGHILDSTIKLIALFKALKPKIK